VTESIINKYRPNRLDEVIGNDAAVNALEAAINNEISSQFLFSGPPGIGKTTLARITARMLSCHPDDIEEVDGATETGIDNVRRITEELMYRPLGAGDRRAIIIDEVHALSAAANKALLKSLEEPPAHVIWCLCTTSPTKLDKAIVTRCLHITLKELSRDDLIGLLGCTNEAQGVDPDIISMCAREADGSPRQALSNLGICFKAKSREEANELLRTAGDAPQAFELARLLHSGGNWAQVRTLLEALKETNPESIRQVVRAYVTKVALGQDKPARALDILEKFSVPFHSADGMSPVVLACANIIFEKT
jgi:DNA polymerase III gamma/tau subunit